MTAATQPRNALTEHGSSEVAAYPMADMAVIWKETMVCLGPDGLAIPCADAPGLRCVGTAVESYSNTQPGHTAGSWPKMRENWVDVSQLVKVSMGYDGGPVSQADVLSPVYVVDDSTVTLNVDFVTNLTKAGILDNVIDGETVMVSFSSPGLL